jgi:hypothetical protein
MIIGRTVKTAMNRMNPRARFLQVFCGKAANGTTAPSGIALRGRMFSLYTTTAVSLKKLK